MSAKVRAVDHLVLAVRDLDRAAAFYERLGFRTTPRGVHPWGTHNRLVQFADRTFLELLTVGEPGKIADAAPGAFSFGAFNRDVLAEGEGMSMLVLASDDEEADRADFAAHGLATFAPFAFERIARAADGEERKVAFRLTFTADPALPRAGFFTCRHLFPEQFWKPEFQAHPNGVTGITDVAMTTRDPADHHVFLEAFTGCRSPGMTSYGLNLGLANGALRVLSPPAFRHRFGEDAEDTLDARFRAATFGGADLGALARRLTAEGVRHRRRGDLLVVPAEAAYGVTLAFAA